MAQPQDEVMSVTHSEATSWSQVTPSSAGSPDQLRTSVTLTNGTTLFVPVPQDATVFKLHQEALRRATRFGYQWRFNDSFLETTGRQTLVLDGEDKVLDVLDLTRDSTFSLCSIKEGSPSSLTLPLRTADEKGLVHIRWITLEDTLLYQQLSKIPIDDVTISENTPVSQFCQIARDRLNAFIPRDKLQGQVNLHTSTCRLGPNNPASLKSLGLTGSRSSPLNIFVDIDLSSPDVDIWNISDKLAEEDAIKKLWGFATTKRGVCTFTSTLKICLKKNTKQEITAALFSVAPFPLLVPAIQRLMDYGIDAKCSADSLRLVAQTLQTLCLQAAPRWISSDPSTALEASRQVINWMASLGSELAAIPMPKIHKLVVSTKDKPDVGRIHGLKFSYDYAIDIACESGSDISKAMVIATDSDDEERSKMLGQLMHESSTKPGFCDYYFDYGHDGDNLFIYQRIETLQPTDFDLLLQSTSLSSRFRMVGPNSIGNLLSNQLPVLTLGSTGLVSVYDHEDHGCGERYFVTWNVIDKKEVLKGNPGQYLMQKLEPIIEQRKKDNTFDVDAWSETKISSTDFGTPDEALVVCIDSSASMETVMQSGWIPAGSGQRPARLTEVKEFFKNFALRVSAMKLPTYLGLVTFSGRTQIQVQQQLTPVHLNFEDQVETIRPQSNTAIFDGICRAYSMLMEVRERYPTVKCRIMILTDGQDNASSLSPQSIGHTLSLADIVLDSIVIDTAETDDLFKISRLTGGYAFAPRTQQEFFQIFLLENVTDIRTRPDTVKVDRGAMEWSSFAPKKPDMADMYTFPPCRPHPNQSDLFVALSDADRYLSRQTGPPTASIKSGDDFSVHSLSTRSAATTAVTGTTLSRGAGGFTRVVLAEVKEMINHAHEFMDVYVSESNMGFWKVVMQGPPDSPYAHGVFMLYIEIGEQYPIKPPAARFITPILHPNITKHGRICHPIFDREWDGTTRIYQVLQHIWAIFMTLEARDAVDPLSALKFWTDPEQGKVDVANYIQRFATKSRADLRREVVGDESSNESAQGNANWDQDSVTSRTTTSTLKTPSQSQKTASTSTRNRHASDLTRLLASQRTGVPLMTTSDQPDASNASNTPDSTGNRSRRRASFFKKFKR